MQVSTNTNRYNIPQNSDIKTASQYTFWQDPKAGLPFLDDKANAILNDILSKKGPHEAFLVKATMMINMQHPVSVGKEGNVFRGNIHDFKTSAPDVQKRLNAYAKSLQNSHKGLPDELGLTQIAQKLAGQYTAQTTSAEKNQHTEETKSKNLEQFYNKEVQQKAETTKVALEKTHKSSINNHPFDPNKPLDFLDKRGNELFNKALDGKTEQEKIGIKVILNFHFHYLASLRENGGDIHNLYYVGGLKTDYDSVKARMQDYFDTNKSMRGFDKIGILDTIGKFLQSYTPEKTIPQHESRYETLMKMNHDNMTPAQHAEFSHLSANRPLEGLSDEANKALAKSLEGKSDEEKGQIKAIISLELTTSIKMDKGGNIVHGARDFSKKSHDEIISKIQQIINNTTKDMIGAVAVLKDFLSLYEQSNKAQENQNATLENLLKEKSA